MNSSRIVICRPVGGLNDCLCQIEKTVAYASLYGREVLVDLSVNPFLESFFQIVRLNFDGKKVSIVQTLPQKVLEARSTWPPEIGGRVGTYSAIQDPTMPTAQRFDSESGARLSFDFDRDYQEEVLVHHSAGGGRNSRRLIPWMELRDEAVEHVRRIVASLPTSFYAVHIRHTDYKTPYKKMLRKVAKLCIGKHVLVVSDNQRVLNWAERRFGSRGFFTLGPLPTHDGQPLHLKGSNFDSDQHRNNALRLVCELAAVRAAVALFYTYRENRTLRDFRLGPRVSGFSALLAGVMLFEPNSPFFGVSTKHRQKIPKVEIIPTSNMLLSRLNYFFYPAKRQAGLIGNRVIERARRFAARSRRKCF